MGADTQVTEVKFQALRELIEVNFRHIRERLERLQNALEHLAVTAVTEEAYQRQSQSIQRAHARLNSHEEKLQHHQYAYRLLELLGGLLAVIVLAILVALATGKAAIVWQ